MLDIKIAICYKLESFGIRTNKISTPNFSIFVTQSEIT